MPLCTSAAWLLICHAILALWTSLAAAVSSEKPLQPIQKPTYGPGQAIPVSCLNRTIDTGEHIADAQGQLQYIPFPTCNETGRPLELYFGVEKDINCTISEISDPFFHLLEFYVHNDAPLTCRIPSRPLISLTGEREIAPSTGSSSLATADDEYIPLIFALTGALQSSHLHISNNLNVLIHAAPKSTYPGVVSAAIAYSISHATRNTRIIIGDPLPLRLSVRWYPNTVLPSGWRGVGGHLYLSTFVYCLLSAGAATAICVAYFRGIDLPKRLRSHGRERLGLAEMGRGYSGYGYGVGANGGGVGNGYGISTGIGKRD
ncbi:MAG: hypothetical protein M1819_003244 [Sarea resinae]|nr:MAG: hypothetical protein M1819_003244 [Sarea resinae]